jgi:serine/threonine-protein kinase
VTPRFYLLGGIELRGGLDGGADRLLSQSKAVALLAYLALAPVRRYQRRDRIVGLLWPELDQTHARAALRKALHVVRTTLGTNVVATRADEELALANGALWCDVVEFNAAVDATRLARALELYRGEVMPGFHLHGCSDWELWLHDQRAAARERATAAAWALAIRLEQDSQFTDASVWARRSVRLAGPDERALRRALTMLDRLGDRAGAVQLYEEFARRLRSELDAEPSAESRELIAALRRGTSTSR